MWTHCGEGVLEGFFYLGSELGDVTDVVVYPCPLWVSDFAEA